MTTRVSVDTVDAAIRLFYETRAEGIAKGLVADLYALTLPVQPVAPAQNGNEGAATRKSRRGRCSSGASPASLSLDPPQSPKEVRITATRIRTSAKTNENKQGWSTLVTAPKSRIGDKHGMIARLGPVHWASFLEHANMHHKAAFLALFTESDRLVCSGPLEGGHCPRDFGLSMTEAGDVARLDQLHLDHRYDLQRVCEIWKAALPATPASWDDGLDGLLLCHLLFGASDHPNLAQGEGPLWETNLSFRCAPPRFSVQVGVTIRGKDCCHTLCVQAGPTLTTSSPSTTFNSK